MQGVTERVRVFLLKVMKVPKLTVEMAGRWLYNSVNVLKAIALNTLNDCGI